MTGQLPPPSVPMDVAREYVADKLTHPDGVTLRHWRGGWWEWQGSRWQEIEDRAMSARAYHFTEHAFFEHDGKPMPWTPNRHKVADFKDALAAVTILDATTDQPGWIDAVPPTSGVIVSCSNGLLDVSTRKLMAHTPSFWTQTAVPFAYDAASPKPERWLGFLDELYGDDADSIDALQEWFGYVISGRLDLHKILLIVGPTRAGKGVTARVLGKLIGGQNVAGPTLSSLSTDFGLAPLLGKPLAIISDARLGRDSHVVVERLLSISGEDELTVNRKYRDQWTGKLPTRLVLMSNELPRLGDASMAIAGRFVTLILTQSWFRNEDPKLEPDLKLELTGILNWSLDGLDRLAKSDRFTEPPSSKEALITLQDLASPVAAFVRDCCVIDIGAWVLVDELWNAWKAWAEDNGHAASNKQMFGRNLRAVVPGLRRTRPRSDGSSSEDRDPTYLGVALKPKEGSK